MTQFEMTEKLAEQFKVTMNEARMALEESDWNMLDAALLLERKYGAACVSGGKTAGCKGRGLIAWLRVMFAHGLRNHFVVRHGQEVKLEVPVLIFALLMLASFGTCALLLVVGLFAGCRYSFTGQDFGLNTALDKAADVADRVKQTVAEV